MRIRIATKEVGFRFPVVKRTDFEKLQLEDWSVAPVDSKIETSTLYQYESELTSYLKMLKETLKVCLLRCAWCSV